MSYVMNLTLKLVGKKKLSLLESSVSLQIRLAYIVDRLLCQKGKERLDFEVKFST